MSSIWPATPIRSFDRSIWVPAVGLWGVGALLSAAQIFLRDSARGFAVPWPDVLLANLLAWLPWLLIAPLALYLERRFAIVGSQWRRNVSLHVVVAVALAASFLFYLAMFHLVYLQGHRFPIEASLLRGEYADKLGRFFLTSLLLYGAIVATGLARRTIRAYQAERHGATEIAARHVQPATAEPLTIRSIGRVDRVDPSDVSWIEGCGNYARLHLDGKSMLLRRTLASLADELGPARFVRVHRSAIVNVERISGLRRRSHGEATLVLRDGQTLKVSRTYRGALEKLVR